MLRIVDLMAPIIGILKRRHLEDLMRTMVAVGDAMYEPEGQTSAIMLYWRRPEQWAETIHEWVRRLRLS